MGGSRRTWRTKTDPGSPCKLHTKIPGPEWNPQPSWFEVTGRWNFLLIWQTCRTNGRADQRRSPTVRTFFELTSTSWPFSRTLLTVMKPLESMWMPLCFRKPVAGTLPVGGASNNFNVCCGDESTRQNWIGASVQWADQRHLLQWRTRPHAGPCRSSAQLPSAVRQYEHVFNQIVF